MLRCRKCNKWFNKRYNLKIHLLKQEIRSLRREVKRLRLLVEVQSKSPSFNSDIDKEPELPLDQ